MAVKIRLRRMGAKKRPFYRIVVADSRSARDGRFIESIGYYDPTTEPPTMKVDGERAKHWIERGAKPTDTAGALLKKQGLLGAKAEGAQVKEEAPKRPRTTRKKAAEISAEVSAPQAETQPEAEAAPAAAKETKAKPKVKAEPKTRAKAKAKTEAEAGTETKAAEAEPEAEAKAEAETETPAEAEAAGDAAESSAEGVGPQAEES